MIRRLSVWVVAPWLLLSQSEQRPVFRTTTLGVSVHASVWNGETMVDRLNASDFELFDQGVKQTVTAVAIESMPNDISFVVDMSGSVVGNLNRFEKALKAMFAMLRPMDRARLITFSLDIQEILPMGSVSETSALTSLKAGGATRLYDAIELAMKWSFDPSRRHLVVVMTDGYDTASTTKPWLLPLLAARSDSVLFIGLAKTAAATEDDVVPNLDSLRRSAAETGGTIYPFRDAVDLFRRVLREFRGSYVFRYTPQGVPSDGWHDVEVRVLGRPNYIVKARRGYFAR